MAFNVTCPHCDSLMQVEDDLAGQEVLCPTCGQTLSAAPTAAAPGLTPPRFPGVVGERPERRVGLAATSLVMGILGFCSGGLLGLGGVILGIVALVKAAATPTVDRGRGLAIAGITTGALSLLVVAPMVLIAILLPSLSSAREHAKRAVCQANLNSIHTALEIYADDHGGLLPDKLAVLVDEGYQTSAVLVCPVTDAASGHADYHYQPGLFDECPDGRIVLYEDLRNHGGYGGNVCWCNGTVNFIPADQWDGVMQEGGVEGGTR